MLGTKHRASWAVAWTVGALALAAVLPASAAASYPWPDQAAMQNETSKYLRSSFMVDTEPGEVIPRSLFLSEPYIDFYEGEGFDRNFFAWAPETSVGDEYIAGRTWTGCEGTQIPVAGGPSYCAPSAVRRDPFAHLIRKDVETGPLTGFLWGESFVSNICGNWSPANTASKASPMPVISGVKYEDLNANGVRDPGDPGLAGWAIELFYEGKYVESTTTGADGSYSFQLNADTLPIGEGAYTLEEVPQPGWTQSQAPGPVVVHYGAGNTTFRGNDFGNWRPATISGHKFDDSDVDGSWGSLDSPLSGWTIDLSNGEQRTSGTDGGYSFSVRPGSYTVSEQSRSGWRQTAPGGTGTFGYTVRSGQVVQGADFGNVCLGSVAVEPIDDSTGAPLSSLEVRIEEVSVRGILKNEPPLPRTTTGTPTFGELLPGTYRVIAFLPEGVFTTDPEAVPVEGRFAIVKEVTVSECETAAVPLHVFTQSTPGKVTGGVQIAVPGGFANSGFEFMANSRGTRGTLQYDDHASGLKLHADVIEAISVSGNEAIVWGKVEVQGAPQRFRLRLVDAGEPGREDRFEITLATGYQAGQGETISAGNIQIHA
jgi:hypothetical protein